jgi:3-oxoacyl-[acyl-carrier-protein] synthase III
VLPGGGSLHPASHETVDKKMHFLKIEGREVFKFAVNVMTDMINNILVKYNLKQDDIGAVVAHQANYRIIEAVSRRVSIPLDKMYMNVQTYGNTSSASIPIALREAIDAGKVPEGKYVVLCAFGGGLTWTSLLLKW